MPLPSYEVVKKQRDEAMAMVVKLSTDPNYGVTTRPAIEYELRHIPGQARHVVFMDIDDCHGANLRLGYTEVNKRVKRAVNVRHADVLIRARWFSGDELIFILSGDPEGFIRRLYNAFRKVDLSVTCDHTVYTGDLESDVAKCAAAVQAKKTGHTA